MTGSPWLTLTEASDYARRGKRFLAREVKSGRLRAARVGGRGEILTRREWLDAYLEELAAPVQIMRRRA